MVLSPWNVVYVPHYPNLGIPPYVWRSIGPSINATPAIFSLRHRCSFLTRSSVLFFSLLFLLGKLHSS